MAAKSKKNSVDVQVEVKEEIAVKTVFCSNCGKKFAPVGREHICPECKAKQKELATEKRKEAKKRALEAGTATIPMNVSIAFRDWVKAQAKQLNMTMPAFCETLMAGSDSDSAEVKSEDSTD